MKTLKFVLKTLAEIGQGFAYGWLVYIIWLVKSLWNAIKAFCAFKKLSHALMFCAATALVASAQPATPSGPFRVRSNLGRCLTYRTFTNTTAVPSNAPPNQLVYLDDCSRISSTSPVQPQDIWTREINSRREVILLAGNRVLGVGSPGVGDGSPIELQTLAGAPSPNQIFVLDGDSIILAANRDFVMAPRNASGIKSTPVILTSRSLNDSEFWTFLGTSAFPKPTSGFVRVTQSGEFIPAVRQAAWGSVIEIDPWVVIQIALADCPLPIPSGVTLRGNRSPTVPGALLFLPGISGDQPGTMLSIQADYVRVTGMRLGGPSVDSRANPGAIQGITVGHIDGQPAFIDPHVIIDHNEMWGWTSAAVGVDGGNDFTTCIPIPNPRPFNTRIARNFIHDNQNPHEGYGVVTGFGGYPESIGNTFLLNRHAIASDGITDSGYGAFANLVLSPVPPGYPPQQDFDMHGLADPGHWRGGLAGTDVTIQGNTFLGHQTNRHNFELRGQSCGMDRFQGNIARQDRSTAILWITKDGTEHGGESVLPPWLQISGTFETGDPTARLGVGDFDGDGTDDLFLATGAAWYYSPRGSGEWRYLNTMPDPISKLLFGDFDGDGRTDVFTQHGRDWLVSWGGTLPWQKINESNAGMSDFFIGDFVGDRRADVFYARGDQWFVSDAGVGPFVPYAVSQFKVSQVRFGDFDGDGKTDVMSVVDNQWKVVHANDPSHQWKILRSKLTDTAQGLIVADFDGNGRADIAIAEPQFSGQTLLGMQWKVSRDGTGNWQSLRFIPSSNPVASIGHFHQTAGADILIWSGNFLQILFFGSTPAQPYSIHEMR